MPPFEQISTFAAEHPGQTAIICVSALVVLVLTFFVLRTAYRAGSRAYRKFAENRPAEDILTIVAASIATGVSAQGMWRFSGDVLGFDGPLRLLLFAFIEVAVITSAVRARRNMRENFSAGIDGIAVWALTSLSAVLSSLDARSMAEAIFRLAAPLVAAWLWERGMAIERHRITGRSRIKWRLTPERAMVRLGLAEVSDRTASEVDAHRRLTRVALAAKRARALRQAGASGRKMRAALARLDKAMDRAVEHTGLAQDSDKQQRMLAQLGALYNTAELLELQTRPFWQPAADDTAAATERDRRGEMAIAGALSLRGRRAEIIAPLVASASTGVTSRAAAQEAAADAEADEVIARWRGHRTGGDTGGVFPPANTTRQAAVDTTGEATRQAAEDDRRRPPKRHDRRQATRQRRAIAASERRHDSTTARTRQGDTTGDKGAPKWLVSERVARVVELLGQKPKPTQGEVAEQLGVTVRTVQRDIERAEADGLVPPGDTTRQATDGPAPGLPAGHDTTRQTED
ncbi:helix-turn-helix domain-containing protein [Sphaerisporangium sp. NPDC004334]